LNFGIDGAVGGLWVDTNTVKLPLHIRLIAIAAALFIVLLAPGSLSGTASAQSEPPVGAELVIFEGTAGPYTVQIAQSPQRPTVGSVRFVVVPVDTATGQPVENALVRIFGTPPGEGERQYSPGLNSPTSRSLYFGQLELDSAGAWTIDVEIDAPQGRSLAVAQTTVNERARSSRDSQIVGTAVFVLVSLAFAGGGAWLWWSSKKARSRRAAIRQGGGKPRQDVG
jgi:hypothetical protein